MANVLCLDIAPETMAILQRNRDQLSLVEARSSEHVIAALEQDATATEVLILGSEVQDPFRIAHHVGAVDDALAVVIMASTDSIQSLDSAIDFLPTLASDVTCAESEKPKDLVGTLESAARRTQDRRILRAQYRAAMATANRGLESTPLFGEFLVRLFDQVPIAVVVLNPNGLIQSCNPQAVDILTCHELELISRPLVLLFPESEWERLSHFLARCSATERRIPPEFFQFVSPESKQIRVEIQATPFKGRGGDRGTLVFLKQVSSHQAIGKNPKPGVVSTDDIPHLASVAGFAGEVAHELNNELVPVVGNADILLQKKTLDPADREILERIFAGGTRAAAIAQQLQSLAGTTTLHCTEIDLVEFVRGQVTHLDKGVPPRIALMFELEEEGLSPAYGDTDLLKQVLQNLVSSATRAMGVHSGQIQVSVGQDWPHEDRLLQGTHREELLGLPLPYFQVTDNATGKDGANRLGNLDRRSRSRSQNVNWRLASVVGAVRLHEGLLEIDFPSEGGMSFRVLLPTRNVMDVLQTAQVDPDSVPTNELLIVDDEESVRSLTKTILEMNGISALTANSLSDARELLLTQSTGTHTVVIDASLCQKDAVATAEFRAEFPDLSIILCSGHDRYRVEKEYKSLNAKTFLQKPFTVDALISAVGGVAEDKTED